MPHNRQGFLVVEYPGSNDKYEGEWVLGKKEGKGRYTSNTGDVYEGEFRAGTRNGVGMYRYSNGDTYEGQWLKGKKHGEGTMTFISGAKYRGGYKEDKKHNLGTYTHADGSEYTGEYKKGKPSGRGIYTFPTGEKFEGEFLGGYKHGAAAVTLADGLRYTAKYHLGKRVSRKHVSSMPWGYISDNNEEDILASVTPLAGGGGASRQERRVAQGHKDMFSFIDKANQHKGFMDAHASSDSDEFQGGGGSPRSTGMGFGDGSSVKGGMSPAGSKGRTGKASSQNLDEFTRLPDYSQGFKYEVARTRRIGSGVSHLVSAHHDDDEHEHPHEDEDEDESDHARWATMLFNTIDIDQSGTLSRTEIHLALKRYGFSDAKIDLLFNAADVNSDNVLSVDEFNQGMVPILLAAEAIKAESEIKTKSRATHYIDVIVEQCRNLPPVDMDFTSDVEQKEGVCNPFVEILLCNQRIQTKVVRETLNPIFQQTHRLFVSELEASREIEVRVRDWVTGGDNTVIGIVRVAVNDVVEDGKIEHEWFPLENPAGAGFVGHHGEPSQISLAFRSEVVPVVLSVSVRRAENLSLDVVDTFTRIAVAGQVQDTRVVHQQRAPVYNASFDFNVFSEDLVKEMVVTVKRLRGGGKSTASFIGQCRFNLLQLLESRASKDGWSTLMDKDLNPIPANGVDGSAGYARVWITISCNLRSDDHQALSELGYSRDASGKVSLRSTAAGSMVSGSSGAAFPPSSTASGLGNHVASMPLSIAASIDSEGSTQSNEDDDRSTEGEFVDDDVLGEPAAGSLDYKTWQTRATRVSESGSSRMTEAEEEDAFLSFVGSSASSASRSVLTAPSQGSSDHRSALSSGARHRRPAAKADVSSSDTSGIIAASQTARAGMAAEESSGGKARTLSKGEEVEIVNLGRKAAKAEEKGKRFDAAQYRKEIARIQGVPYVPQDAQAAAPSTGPAQESGIVSGSSYVSSATAASRSSSAAASLRSDLSRRLPGGDAGASSGIYSYSSATGDEETALTSQSESQSDISFGIAGLQSQCAASATAASVTSAASSVLASNATRSVSSAGGGRRMRGRDGGGVVVEGGDKDEDDAPEPGEAAGKMKKGLFKRLNPFAKAT